MNILPTGLSFIFGLLRRQLAKRCAPRLGDDDVVDVITPQLDAIQSEIEKLKIKDLKVAQDQFQTALNSMRSKIQVAFLVTDNRVLNRPLGLSLRSFARTAHSAYSLRSAPLRSACFARLLCSRARSFTLPSPLLDS